MAITIDDVPAGWMMLTCEKCQRLLPEGSFTEDENYEDCTICHDCHQRMIHATKTNPSLQLDSLIVFLNDERIAALAACDWNRANRFAQALGEVQSFKTRMGI